MPAALSLVIPAYNEVRRLPPYLESIRAHCAAEFGEAYEVLVVDDGSRDGLADVLRALLPGWPQLNCCHHVENRGKGAAVRTGMLAARGERLLFADADGATPITEECRLRAALDAGADVAIGSRLVAAAHVQRQRQWTRALVGRLFAIAARNLLQLPVHDTQCGFKMFRRELGQRLFQQTTETGYLFDLEVLMLAVRLGYRIVEVPVHWSDQPGSKLHLRREFWRIWRDLWRLRQRQITLGSNSQPGNKVL